MLLEDAVSVASMMEATGRTVPRVEWIEEARVWAEAARIEDQLGGMF
jgi:hypothetical protein